MGLNAIAVILFLIAVLFLCLASQLCVGSRHANSVGGDLAGMFLVRHECIDEDLIEKDKIRRDLVGNIHND
jgi:hypothetical protein